jgi:acetate---CoA ligase (ADP-forming)
MPNISAFLCPSSVAVVGASNDTGILRGRIMETMLGHHYAGEIFPVSRTSTEVMGLKAYPTVSDLPTAVDLAVLIIPAQFVAETLRECGRKGIRAAQIITSGFAEQVGEEGARQQAEIRRIAEEFDMAVCGPNSEGFANTRAELAPTFSPAVVADGTSLVPGYRKDGFVTAIAQSGGIGFAYFDHGRPKELPFNYVITTGNEAALEAMDFVEHLIDNDESDVFVLFMEDAKTPAKLVTVAEKALRAGKPLIVTKVGQSDSGRRAAASHTGALAGDYAGYRAIFKHYGVIESNDIDEMTDIAACFSHWRTRLPRGRRVGITTGSGGAGGLMADIAAAAGLEIPVLDVATRAEIDQHLPPYGSSQNPVDATAQAVTKLGYARLNEIVVTSPAVDAVIGICSAKSPKSLRNSQDGFTALTRETDKPLVMCSYTTPSRDSMEIANRSGLPLLGNMHACARALAEMANYREVRERFLKRPPIKTSRSSGSRADVAARLAKTGQFICEYEAKSLLAAYGIPSAGEHLVTTVEDAARAAEEIGDKVAMKIQSPDILHKTEAKGVALNVSGATEAREAFARLIENAKYFDANADVRGVLIQPMAHKGREVIVGVTRDAAFGPMVMVGLGGVLVEVLKDVALAPAPLGSSDAMALLDGLKGRSLLDAWRGDPPADVAALCDLMVSLSQFAADFADEIQEIDLNPVLVHAAGEGLTVVDAIIVKRQ